MTEHVEDIAENEMDRHSPMSCRYCTYKSKHLPFKPLVWFNRKWTVDYCWTKTERLRFIHGRVCSSTNVFLWYN
jgi:hypothetical protein